MRSRTYLFLGALFIACLFPALAVEAQWPQFRGPDGQGNAPELAPLEWNEEQGVRWKTPLPGRGWSSPVVSGNQIWVTTAISQAADPEELKSRVKGLITANAMEMAAELSLRAVCVARDSGDIVHDIEVFHIDEPNPIHSLNSYASPTPILDEGRLYCNFGRYGTKCLDTETGEVVWERKFPIEHYVGPGSSPVICDDLLILTCDGADQQFIVAVDKRTGDTVWKEDRPHIRATNPDFRKSYCTPLVVEEDGQRQIVIPGAQWIIAYAPEDGREIWRLDHGRGFSVVPRPVADSTHVYCFTGYGGAKLVAVRRGGTGDITDTHADWKFDKQVPTQPSPVLYKGRLFMISDNGIAQCLDTETQEVVWKQRLPGNYSASCLKVGDRVYFFSREGVTKVIDATSDSGEVLCTNELDGSLMATPAVVDGELILRTDTHLYAIGT